MKLKEFKKNNTLVALYVDSFGLANKMNLNNCIYSIAKQRTSVDLIVLQNSLSESEVLELEGILKDPFLTVAEKDKEGVEVIKELRLEEGDSFNYTLVKTEAKSFPQMFNIGFNTCVDNDYEFFSIIEQDDTYAIHWFEYAERYASEEEENSVFLPLIRHVVEGEFKGLINEAAWVDGMAEQAGITDINLLLRFQAINPLGGLFRVASIKESSELEDSDLILPMKESFKITHSYEFFLRMIYDDIKVKTIDRIGYELKVISRDSFNEASSKIPQNLSKLPADKGGVTQAELQHFVDLAKKEYFYPEDRKKVFVG